MTRQALFALILVIAAGLGGSVSMAETVTLPLNLDDNGHLRVPVKLQNGKTYDFILDTAASRTSIMQTLVTDLGLKPEDGESGLLHGSGGQTRIDMYAPMVLRVGGSLAYETPLLPAVGQLDIPGQPFYGILGSDFFEQYVVEIDAQGRRLILSTCKAGDLIADGDFAAVPIHRHDAGIWLLDATIGDVSVIALLDTGARTSVLNPATASALDINLPASMENGNERITGSAGHATHGIGLQLDQLRAGTRVWPEPQVMLADMHIFKVLDLADRPAMILASDLLFQGRTIVDYGDQTVYFQRN